MLDRWYSGIAVAVALILLAVNAVSAGDSLSSPTAGWRLPIVNEWQEERATKTGLADQYQGGGPPDEEGFVDYEVTRGDTLWSIARKHGLKLASLVQVNGITNPHYIRAGDRLIVPPIDGVMYRLEPGQSMADVGWRFGVGLSELVDANRSLPVTVSQTTAGEFVFVPGAEAPVLSGGGDGLGAVPRLVWPVCGRITSGFGLRWGRPHTGIDIAAPHGTSVRAADRGRVVSVGWLGSYGRTVLIDHGSELDTLYGHLSTVHVRAGQQVQRGEIIGQVGSTGNSTGPHLHFEVRKRKTPCDPIRFLGGGE